MTSNIPDAATVADQFFTALERGDAATIMKCFSPNAWTWHNFDNVSSPAAEMKPGLEKFFESFPTRQMLAVRRHLIDGGLVQQHTFRLHRPDGKFFDQPVCIVMKVDNGRIQSVEEYVDLESFTKGAS